MLLVLGQCGQKNETMFSGVLLVGVLVKIYCFRDDFYCLLGLSSGGFCVTKFLHLYPLFNLVEVSQDKVHVERYGENTKKTNAIL